MISLQQVALAVFCVFVIYVIRFYLKVCSTRSKLECWLPSAPRVPVLGSIFEFRGPTESLKDVARLVNNPSKLSYMEVVGEWVILCQNYDLTEFVLTSSRILTKSVDYKYLEPWLNTGLLNATGRKWKAHRRVITPAFHFSILEQFVNVFDSHIKVLIEKLKREVLSKDSFDVYGYITACTLDIICETAMGVNIDAQNDKNKEYVAAGKSMCNIVASRSLSVWKRNDTLFKFAEDYKKQCENLKILHGFTNSVIEERKKALEANTTGQININEQDDLGRKRKKAFLDLLLNSTIDDQPLSQEEIREEVDTFMFAGHDTTGSAISSAFYVLAQHPDVQKLIREELRRIFGKYRDRATTYQDLQDMKYLEAVIKEVLRLYPPAPMIARVVEEDIEYKGHTIPKDTIISIFIYGINRDPDYYKEPELFKPERFLESATRNPFSFIPFSAGPRNCIGQKFAMLEMKSFISKVLTHFDILPANPPHKLLLTNEVVLKSLNGVHIKLQECQWENVLGPHLISYINV